MKKGFSLLFLSTTLAASTMMFSGCKNQETSKIRIHYGELVKDNISNITELPKLTYNGLSEKILNNESFLLAIYGEETCGCWTDYQPVLTAYVNDTHQKIDYISSYDFIGKDNTFGLYLVTSDLPSLAVFENGQLKIQSVYLRDDRTMFKSYSKFKEFIDNNVVLPKMLYVEKDELDSMIEDNIEIKLYVARSACGDCSAVNRDVLLEWSKSVGDVTDKLYIFDIQKYYPVKPTKPEEDDPDYEEKMIKYEEDLAKYEEDSITYQNIKDYYGLSNVNNTILGYGTGSVPTFQRRKGMDILDMVVVLNDSVDRGNKKVVSYFTEERVNHMNFLKDSSIDPKVLDGFSLTDEQTADWRNYRSQFYMARHYPIARLFISTYVK